MATVRKRVRVAANGEEKIAWVADYFDQHRQRHLKTFATRKAASAWLVETQGKVARGVHTPERQSINVYEAAQLWLERGRTEDLERATLRGYEALVRLHGRMPDVGLLAEHFHAEAVAGRPTVERIVERVGTWFQVEPRQMQSRARSRHGLLPRQVGMYLARQLTPLSLQQIGAYFGGRDHSTVLHACRKVERALTHDAALSGAVRRLWADLA